MLTGSHRLSLHPNLSPASSSTEPQHTSVTWNVPGGSWRFCILIDETEKEALTQCTFAELFAEPSSTLAVVKCQGQSRLRAYDAESLARHFQSAVTLRDPLTRQPIRECYVIQRLDSGEAQYLGQLWQVAQTYRNRGMDDSRWKGAEQWHTILCNPQESIKAASEFMQGTARRVRNPQIAFDLYQNAYRLGSTPARYALGKCHLYGSGCSCDPTKARQHFEAVLADAATPDSFVESSYIYYHLAMTYLGQDGEDQQAHALALLSHPSLESHKQATYEKAELLLLRAETQEKKQQALSLFLRAAELGETRANRAAARMLYLGIGCEVDLVAADKLTETMTTEEKAAFTYQLARTLVSQLDSNQEAGRLSLELYSRSMQEGNPHAARILIEFYLEGIGTSVNNEKALELFYSDLLKEQTDVLHELALDTFKNGSNQTTVFRMFEHLASKGHPGSMYMAGYMLFSGQGVSQDKPRALSLIAQAAQAGDPDAQAAIASAK